MGASSLAVPVLAARPVEPAVAAGVFPPWWTPDRVIAAASEAGAVLRVGALPFIVVVRTEIGGDAAGRLGRQGALFSLDPGRAIFCGAR